MSKTTTSQGKSQAGAFTLLHGAAQDENLGSTGNVVVLAVGRADTIEVTDGARNTLLLAGAQEVGSLGPSSSNNEVIVAGGSDTVSVGGSNRVDFYGANGDVQLLPTLRADSLVPLNAVNVTAHGAGELQVGGTGGSLNFQGDSGRYTIEAATASATISGGSGGGLFEGGDYAFGYDPIHRFHAGNNVITAGLGRSTLVGSQYGTSKLEAVGSAHDVLMAEEYGQTTISGGASTGNDLLEGYLGPFTPSADFNHPSPMTLFTAGSGNDTLVAGAGASTMASGAGNDVFRFIDAPSNAAPGGNAALIANFTPGKDHIDLQGFATTPAETLAAADFTGGGTVLHLDGGTTVTVTGANLLRSDLTRS